MSCNAFKQSITVRRESFVKGLAVFMVLGTQQESHFDPDNLLYGQYRNITFPNELGLNRPRC